MTMWPAPGRVDSLSMQSLVGHIGKTVMVFFLVARGEDMQSRQGTLEEVNDDGVGLRSGDNVLVIPFSAIAYVQVA